MKRKILGWITLMTVGLTACLILVVDFSIRRSAVADVRNELRLASSMCETAVRAQLQDLKLAASKLAGFPWLVQAVDHPHPGQADQAAEADRLRKMLNYDLLAVYTDDGRVVVQSATPELNLGPLGSSFHHQFAVPVTTPVQITELDNQAIELATVPVSAHGTPKGILLLARVIDANWVRNLSGFIEHDLAVVTPHQVHCSPGLQKEHRHMRGLLHAAATTTLRMAGAEYLLTEVELPHESASLLIAANVTAALNRHAGLKFALLSVGGGLLLLFLLIGFYFTNRLLRPISALTAGASDISNGHLDVVVNLERDDELGALATAFNAMTRDIRTARDQVVQAASYTDAIVNSMTDALLVLDSNLQIRTANQSAGALLGYAVRNLEGMSLLDLINAESASEESFAQFLISPSRTILHDEEIDLLHSSGASIPVSFSGAALGHRPSSDLAELLHAIGAAPIRTSPAGDFGFVCMARDLRRRKDIERALRESEEKFMHAQKMDAFGRLAGGIAHDFNNLLMAILGFGRIALEEIQNDEHLRPEVEQVLRAGDQAAKLTRQLLLFSHQHALRIEAVELNTVVRDMDKLLRRTIGEDIELITIFGEDMGYVQADVGQLEHILVNLAINAREAMPDGGVLQLETAPFRDSDGESHALLHVQDSGFGMTEEVIHRVFEPFFTTKPETCHAGLGLATAYSIVEQFNGSIRAQSTPGVGTTITIQLPTVEVPALAMGRCNFDETPPRGTETLLVVEDDETVRALTVRHLEALGYRVLQATNGTEALRTCKAHQNDVALVITDLIMPHMGGYELMRELRQDHPHLPALYTSGFSSNEVAHKHSHDSLLPKPYTRHELARYVRDVLDHDMSTTVSAC